MKKTILSLLLTLIAAFANAQMHNPIKFTHEFKKISDTEADIIFKASIEEHWHVYSVDQKAGGPTSASFNLDKIKGAELVGKLKPVGKAKEKYDDMFGMNVSYFENMATFIQKVKLLGGDYIVEGYMEYGACNDENCLPPTKIDFKYTGNVPAAKSSEIVANNKSQDKQEVDKTTTQVEETEVTNTTNDSPNQVAELAKPVTNISENSLWKPVIKELKAYEKDQDKTWLFIFIAGFLGGLIALLTPCVWPIIPMTVSFFLKRSSNKAKGLRDAILYGVSIIVIYVTIGLAITVMFGANALNDLSTNAVFNVFFFLMLVVFAASFFGGFELTLPSKWTNAVDSKAEATTGVLSIFLMAFTLSLVSFSCTGPIIGVLLVEASTSGSKILPAIGMFGFALALALPFTFFALFPSLLKSMPKSGGWMNTIKVTLGFLELAFALKFLSVADLAYGWRILDRETFLALWIVIFGLLGVYLLGRIKFPHDDEDNKVSVPRFFLGLISLAFAVYMIPGLWGAPLKAISAFSPPMYTQDFNLYTKEVHAKFKDYEEGMAYAKANNLPVMLDFTGYGCVNCREMEASVWTDDNVRDIMNNKYVLITLYVDQKESLPEIQEVEEQGNKTKLRTVGDKWSYLQRVKFGANAQPFYVLLDNEGNPINKSYSYDKNVGNFVKFLKQGLENYDKGKKK